MNRRLLPLLALMTAPVLHAANIGVHRADPARPFEPFVIVTTQPGAEDFYSHTLSDVGPDFRIASRLWAEQRVFVIISAGNYAVSAANEADLTFDFTVERPDGKNENAGNNVEIFRGKIENPKNILFPREWFGFSTDPGDPMGDYTFVVTVHDRISGENQTLRSKLTVAPFKPAALPDNVSSDEWMMHYYENPKPEMALSALQAMAGKISIDNKNAWPPVISFFGTLLTDNPWLVPMFSKAMRQGSDREKQAIVLVLGYAFHGAIKPPGLSDDEWEMLAEARAEKWPDPDASLTDPSQLDMLWGRFFATGAFAPVDRIASTLAYHPFLGRLEEIRKNGQRPNTVPPEVMKETVLRAALWSLGSIAKEQPLAHHYGEWILANEKLDSISRLLLAKTLGHEIKFNSPKGKP